MLRLDLSRSCREHPARARLALDLAAANRDPHCYPDPHRLDPHRPACAHLSLGAGAHVCAGATVVRDALRLATESLFRPGVGVALAGPGAPPTWMEATTIRGLETLPVVLAPQGV